MTQALEKTSADYTFWQNALAITDGKRPLTREEQGKLNITEDDVGLGFFRKRSEARGPFSVGVATFVHEGDVVALVDGRPADAKKEWLYLVKFPVTEAAYRSWESAGIWSDDPQIIPGYEPEIDPVIAASLEPPSAGHNNPPLDEAEVLRGQIEAASANIGDYAEIKDDESAKKAQGVRSRLLELSGEADTKREAEKRPHLDAGTAVDKRWQPVVRLGKALADQLKAAMSAHETRKKTAADAAARAERVEAERVAALQASPVTGPAAVLQPEPPRQPTAPTPQVSTQIKPSYGRAASTSVVKVATVTDQDALYGFLKTQAELIDLMAKLAQRAVKAGHTPPGVTIEEKVEVK